MCSGGRETVLGSGVGLLVKSGVEPVLGPFSSILSVLGGGTVGREELYQVCRGNLPLDTRSDRGGTGAGIPLGTGVTRGLPAAGFTGTVKGNFFKGSAVSVTRSVWHATDLVIGPSVATDMETKRLSFVFRGVERLGLLSFPFQLLDHLFILSISFEVSRVCFFGSLDEAVPARVVTRCRVAFPSELPAFLRFFVSPWRVPPLTRLSFLLLFQFGHHPSSFWASSRLSRELLAP